MRDLHENYISGLFYLLHDDLISFFAYFTTIFIEIAYIWASGVEKALAFTVLLLACIVNVVVASAWKGDVEGCYKKERVQSRAYVTVFLALFLIGCCIDFVTTILLMGIPFAVTCIWIHLREAQNTIPLGFPEDSSTMKIFRLFQNKFIYILSYVIVLILPIALLAIFIAQTNLPLPLKVLLPIAYALISPLIAYMEDELAAYNVFELAEVQAWPGDDLFDDDNDDDWDDDD